MRAKSLRRLTWAIPILFAASLAFRALDAINEATEGEARLGRSRPVEAQIVEELGPFGGGTHVRVRYAVEGTTRTERTRVYDHEIQIGQQVHLFYDPQDPEKIFPEESPPELLVGGISPWAAVGELAFLAFAVALNVRLFLWWRIRSGRSPQPG